MALETATYINQLVPANPLGSDPIAFADDHIRLIKSALKATFPNITGAVSVTQEALNNGTPVGLISMWSGGTVPAGWTLCNGVAVPRSDGTGNITPPDLRNRFIVGSGDAYAIGATGGAATYSLSVGQLPAHNHPAWTDAQGNHAHSGTTSGVGDHQHIVPWGEANANDAPWGVFENGHYGSGQSDWDNQWRYSSPAGAHSHTFSTDWQGSHSHSVGVGNTGLGQAIENRPPFYALAFIMKV